MQGVERVSTSERAIGAQTAAFMGRCFPEASAEDWGRWQWQLQHRLTTAEALAECLELTRDELAALTSSQRPFPVSVTPYYASLLSQTQGDDPLRRTMVPVMDELTHGPGEYTDPLAEDDHAPVPGVVHRYPDRALFLMGERCPVYCRYCTRSRVVGSGLETPASQTRWAAGIDYIRATPAVRDVLISGGDPLMHTDAKLEWVISRLQAIPHVEMIRIGTKIPMVLPMRITPELVAILKRYHPVYMSIHVTHPRELTPEVAAACELLANAGVVMKSQTVLLKGVNDEPEVMRQLMHGLLRIRVNPYYLLQCDPIHGSAHFRTPVSRGVEIIQALRGHTSGYAVPHFIVDTPRGGGKISLDPEYVTGRDGDDLLIRNYQGQEDFRYHDPV